MVTSDMRLSVFLGIQSKTTLAEKVVAAVGGMFGIFLIFYLSEQVTDYHGALAILPSMGAAAVLLFAVPHGPLSQPWALFAGNMLGALTGVTAVLLIDNVLLAAAVAVGIAILLMHFCRCLHPPGGATALAAVIGGDSIHALGYWYVLTPTLLNCVVIMLTAMLFNNGFPWRRYPLSLMHYEKTTFNSPDTRRIHDHHIREAMAAMDMVVDVSSAQLKQIIDKADELMRQEKLAQFDLEEGAFYTNGQPGLRWSVRQVVDTRPDLYPANYQIIYRTVAGVNRGHSGSCSLEDFAAWAKEKMRPVNKVS